QEVRVDFRPLGSCVGWVSGETLYLDRDAALAEVQRLGRDAGDPLAVTGPTLAKRLHERGYLVSTDTTRNTLYIRKRPAGVPRAVLHLHTENLPAGTTAEDAATAYTDNETAANTEPR